MMQHNKSEKNFIDTLEIMDILLIKSDHNVHKLYADEKLSFSFEKKGDLNIMVLDDIVVFEVTAEVKLQDVSNNEILLSSEAKFASIYSYNKEQLGEEKEKIESLAAHFFRYSAITHILSFAREYFATIITKSGYPRVILPLIKSALDEELIEEASKELQKHSS